MSISIHTVKTIGIIKLYPVHIKLLAASETMQSIKNKHLMRMAGGSISISTEHRTDGALAGQLILLVQVIRFWKPLFRRLITREQVSLQI